MDRDKMIAIMEDQGYQQESPSFESEQMDRQVCNEVTCICGTQGMMYYPWVKDLGERRSYRAFAVCPTCGEAQEF